MKHQLDWSSYRDAGVGDAYADIPTHGGDFARAVAVCINSRQCETRDKGVMCPSYRVTGHPDLSTGGRVRMLKAVLNGDLAATGFAHADLAADLDRSMALCVGCKGCKRECENAVDMAMIKVEYLAQRHRETRPTRRTRLLAGLPRWLHRYPWMRQLTAWRNRSALLARLGERWLGVSAERRLPQPVAEPFLAAQGGPAELVAGGLDPESGPASDPASTVILFIDTFSDRFAPDQADAAVEVLTRAGYRVRVARPDAAAGEPDRPLCCGRTYIAHGLVEQARAEARRVLAVLLPYARAGHRIVGLEPACLLAIRDDYRFLGLGDAADTVAKQAILFEEFIAREISAKRFNAELGPVATGGDPLLVHGHCHQKAVGAMKSMRKVLKAIPGLKFELIEASCCGMAGSFGLEAEHAELSQRMAEQALLPALRERPEARVLANGFSCRHQIDEGLERGAMHLAQLLRESMEAV